MRLGQPDPGKQGAYRLQPAAGVTLFVDEETLSKEPHRQVTIALEKNYYSQRLVLQGLPPEEAGGGCN